MANIGVFDSGIGGLTVLKNLIKSTNANYFYLGDSKRAPYGSRNRDEIVKFTYEIVDFLEEYDIDQYIIACNTISVLATDDLEEKYGKDFYPITKAGVELAADFKGDFLILATKTTADSHYYKDHIEAQQDATVYEVAAENLVGLIEQGITSGEELDSYLREYLAIANEKKLENIILACTHYSIIRDAIEKNLTYKANILNPADKLAEKIRINENNNNNINIFLTEINDRTKKIIDGLLETDYKLEIKEI